MKSSAIKADEAYGTEKSKWSENGFSNVLERCFDGDGITNFIFVKNNGREEYKLFPANIFIYKYCLFLGGEEILFSEYDGTVQSYFVYDCKTNVKTLIKSIKQEIIEKEIALYK